MSSNRKLTRRSFFERVGGAAAAGGSMIILSGNAEAQTYTGASDRDAEHVSDRPGYGHEVRGSPPSSGGAQARPRSGELMRPTPEGPYSQSVPTCSDSDMGAYADPISRGVHCTNPSGASSAGRGSEAVNRSCSDSDGGSNADPGGRGRRC